MLQGFDLICIQLSILYNNNFMDLLIIVLFLLFGELVLTV